MNFPQLTFTRFIAAVLIVLYHFAANKPLIHQLGGLGRVVLIASTFVSYFFVLSGFILVVANAKAVRLQQFPSAANFWINRFARIYPLYFLAFLLSIPQFHEAGAYPTPQALLANVLLCQAWIPLRSFSINFPAWSLSCELFFYLLFPTILRTLMVLKTRIVAIAIVCAYMLNVAAHVWLVNWGAARGMVFTDHWYHELIFHSPIMHLSTFIIGVGFGIIFVRNVEPLMQRAAFWGWLAGGSFCVWFALVITNPPWLLYHHNGLLTPLYLLMITGLSVNRNWIVRLLAAKPLVWLGEISYGIYILQLPVFWLVNLPWLPTVNGIGLASMYIYPLILIGISGLCHAYIETPAKLKIRALFKKGLAPTPIQN